MSAPREYTLEECRERFLQHVRGMIQYWETIPNPHGSRVEGVAFSILVALDGGAAGLPGFIVAPAPHFDDMEYHKKNGENWWPDAGDMIDIAGGLHELLVKKS